MYDYLPQILFSIGFILLALFAYSLLKLRNRLAPLFSLMCLAIAVYVLGYGFELTSTNIEQIKFFLKVEYFGASVFPAFWLMMSYKFYYNKHCSFGMSMAILTIPVLTVLFTATNEYHHLYYANITVVERGRYLMAQLTRGPWYYVYSAYSYFALLFGLFVFFKSWKQASYSIKTQSFWMFIGSVLPGAVNFIYLLKVVPSELDLTAFAFLSLAIAYFIALLKYDFLELKEVVRGHAFGQINEGILVIDDRDRIIDFNNAAQETFGWLNPYNIGKSILSFGEGREIRENANDSFEVEIAKEGQKKYYEFRVTALKEKDKTVGSFYIFQDITKQKQVIVELNYIATHDALSGVYNRRKLMEEAEKELQRAVRYGGDVSVLMIDIDHFKQVNDRYGHLAGDKVIHSVAQACKAKLRSTDIIGRYGGEEFAIILPETDKQNAQAVAEEIRKSIADMEISFDGKSIKVTISIGVASISDGKEQIALQELINEADKALYAAKNSGRNRVEFF